MAVGGSIGIYAARTVKMTQMPELVALMHSLVGLAAVFVGYANYIDPAARRRTCPRTSIWCTLIETYVGIPDRRRHVLGFDRRVRQARGQDQRQAGHPAGTQT